MPRPKRQRPSWLPRWIPYKDGRYLGLARQTLLAWSSTVLALAFFLMTIAYVTEKSRLSKARFVHSSRSNTILVLRVLSEAAGVFLAGSIYSTFEVVQWLLISRPEGIRLPQFLALQSSTGPLGLLVIAFGKGLSAGEWPMGPRIMSLLRLMAELTVPVLGVVIMSNVNTEVIYLPIASTVTPFSVGMEPFNASVASQLGVMEDMLFNIAYVSFLTNPLHAVDINSDFSSNRGDCEKGLSVSTNHSCTRHVMIAQELQNFEAGLPATPGEETSVLLSMNQQVYTMQFQDNIDISKNDLHCEDFHSGPGYYRICTSSGPNDWLHASMIPCPATLVANSSCTTDLSWHSSPGFTTALQPSLLNATISYDRQDGRILSYTPHTTPTRTPLPSPSLLSALTHILNTTLPGTAPPTTNPLLGPPTNFFGRLVTGHMYRISKLSLTHPSSRIKGTNALQSILAMTLYYSQNGVLAQTVLPFAPNASSPTTPSRGAFAVSPTDSLLAYAQTRYRLRIGRGTLIAYGVLGGLAIVVCVVALVVGSVGELGGLEAEPTLWPAWDFFTQCRVEGEGGKVVGGEKRVEMGWIREGREVFREMGGLRVRRRKRVARGEGGMELPGVEGVG
ncbi:hypothetical protein EJ04DRAFT_579546 [Polyplosphaeria fusca]|uniref:Uncharacterized protein n=1 Tax=Polyplosphaeria fusca TaxID=682080 RepID=A0A9P4QQN5_9PLEO|nr:hypothetical protein EJ04DRAFT_579546 [Polyplosphaeria fusca]